MIPEWILVEQPVADFLTGESPTYRDLARQVIEYRRALDQCTAAIDYLRRIHQPE